MKKIIAAEEMNGSQYFFRMLCENGYTAQSFTDTYNNVYPNDTISVDTVRSWSCGRRSLANTAALTILRVAHILDDPDSSESDYERYSEIIYHLIKGASVSCY